MPDIYQGENVLWAGDSTGRGVDGTTNPRLPTWELTVDRGVPLVLGGTQTFGDTIIYKGLLFPSYHGCFNGANIADTVGHIPAEMAAANAATVILMVGGNDVAGTDANVITGPMGDLWDDYFAAGVSRILMCNIMPRPDNDVIDARYTQANIWIAELVVSRNDPRITLADINTPLKANPDWRNANYLPGNIHPNVVGNAIIARAVLPVLFAMGTAAGIALTLGR